MNSTISSKNTASVLNFSGRAASFRSKGVGCALTAGLLSLVLLSPATGADFSGNLKGVTITDTEATNKPPTAAFTYTNSGSTFTFDASSSSDSDGSITEYRWDLGNGSTATGATASTEYTAGTFPVTLTVIDNSAGVGILQQKVTYSLDTVIEDAEDGTTSGWSISDNTPTGATISNVVDNERQSNVIVVQGSGTENAYTLLNADGSSFNYSASFIVEFSVKYSESFSVTVQLNTSAGTRKLIYSNSNTSPLGASTEVKFGLGATAMNGTWQTFTRDLKADLASAQPDVTVTSIDRIIVRGSGRLDDIKFKR